MFVFIESCEVQLDTPELMALDRAEDWLRCRDWLVEVSPVSARSASQVKSEGELYSYLKDGTELCRIVGFLCQRKVPDEILYRTQNIR